MRKNIKIILILLMTLITITIISSNVFASDISSILEAGEDFLKIGDHVDKTIEIGNLTSASSNIFNIFLAAAIIIAVVIGIVLGIQFMASSVEGQAKVKEAVVPYLIGCVIVFAAFPIWEIVVGVGEATEKDVYTKEAGIEMAEQQIKKMREKGFTYGDLVDLYREYYKNKGTNDYYDALLETLKTELCECAEKENVTVDDNFKRGLINGFVEKSKAEKGSQQTPVPDSWYKQKWLPLQNKKLSKIK